MTIEYMQKTWEDRGTTGVQRLALLALADEAQHDGFVEVDYERLGRKMNASADEARQAVNDLEAAGMVYCIMEDAYIIFARGA